MILDQFKLQSVIVQITYADAFELWDSAGSVARLTTGIWPGLELDSSKPNEQVFQTPLISIQVGLKSSTITLKRTKMDDGVIQKIAKTLDVWRSEMNLVSLNRVSCRCRYLLDFPTKEEANQRMISLGMVSWPNGKVFDQPENGSGNSAELALRFEDEFSFAVLRVGSEHFNIELKANPDLENEAMTRQRHSLFIDFDRGYLAFGDSSGLRFDQWWKGYQHILRRDLPKLIGGNAI